MSDPFDPKKAAAALAAAAPPEGEVLIEKDRFTFLDMVPARELNDTSAAEFDFHRRKAFTRWSQVQDFLLEDHQIAFKALGSAGAYMRVPAAEQAEWALTKGVAEARGKMGKAALRIRHVNVDGLTQEQKQARADRAAKTSQFLAALGGRPRRY